ncbi:MAG: carbon-nitrogen hydrolase family protein [Clostridium sp.]|nr:carbon-nitrogen hydrolase family protein [Clostridium sp.]
MKQFKIALVQVRQIQSSIDTALEKGLEYCKRAKQLGADIVLFPEMYSIGYQPPFERAFDYPDESGHDKELEYWHNLAISEDSYFISEFCKCAKELEIAIIITYLKKDLNKPCNSLSVIDRDGNIILNYSKVHTCDFSFEKFCESGKNFNVAELNTKQGKVNIGTMICFDREFPESARTLALMGAEIIFVPNCCPFDDNRKSQLKARAFENMCAIAMANYAGENLGKSMVFDGMAYNENGEYHDMLIAELDRTEQIAIATIDLDELREYRLREVWGNKYRKPQAYNV